MEEFNLKATFKFIKRNFKVLAVTFVASAVVTAGITLLLPNYYKAQVVLLPSDTNSISKGVLSNMDNVDPMNFGSSSDCEYVLDIINSGRIVGAACTKFNLAEHYGIKASGRELDEKMGRKLYNNIKVKRTDNLGVKIIGTSAEGIDAAEDRERFQALIQKLHLLQPQKPKKSNMIRFALLWNVPETEFQKR